MVSSVIYDMNNNININTDNNAYYDYHYDKNP